jgi:hypothetical protein
MMSERQRAMLRMRNVWARAVRRGKRPAPAIGAAPLIVAASVQTLMLIRRSNGGCAYITL